MQAENEAGGVRETLLQSFLAIAGESTPTPPAAAAVAVESQARFYRYSYMRHIH